MSARGWVALAFVAALSTRAHGQTATDEVGIERFRIAMDRAGVLGVEWAGVPSHLSWSAGLSLGFSHDPLVVYDRNMDAVQAVVDRRVTTTLSGSIALWERLELGMAVDLVGLQRGTELSTAMSSLPGAGIGDLRLVGKLLALGGERLQLAFVPSMIIPGGSARGYLREAGVVFSPAVAISMRLGRLRASANLGYDVKPRVETAGLVSDDELFVRLGAALAVGAVASPIVELWWATTFARPSRDTDPGQTAAEMLLGGSRQITPSLGAFAAFGIGLDSGFGTPDYRALAGVRFEVASQDADGDGVIGASDRCPDAREDKDGFEDADGCPDPDNDADGVADATDRCPGSVEDRDSFQDGDGCIDPDNDGDGIADTSDRCADTPEDKDGFLDEDGCPDDIAHVNGKVVDPEGRPIGGATLTITMLDKPGAAPIELVADADGLFAQDLDGGSLQVVARAREYKDGTAAVTIEPGTSGSVSVTLARAVRQGQLRGQVLAFDGHPLAATITVTGSSTATATADETGMFSIELPAGTFTVSVSSPGFTTQKRNVSIKLDGVTVLNVDLRGAK